MSSKLKSLNHLSILVFLGILLIVNGCLGTYEYRTRTDNSEVAVIRDIDNVFPVVAQEVVIELNAIDKLFPIGKDGNVTFKTNLQHLYEQKDQLNAQLRDFVVANYQSYINSELDSDPNARIIGRKLWREVILVVQDKALEIRKIKEELKGNHITIGQAKEGFIRMSSDVELLTWGLSSTSSPFLGKSWSRLEAIQSIKELEQELDQEEPIFVQQNKRLKALAVDLSITARGFEGELFKRRYFPEYQKELQARQAKVEELTTTLDALRKIDRELRTIRPPE